MSRTIPITRKRTLNSGFKYAPAVKTAVSLAKSFYKNYSKTKNSASQGTSAPVTNQFDVRTTYNRKRRSRQSKRKARTFKRFSRKVFKAVESKNATQKIVIQENQRISSSANAQFMSGSKKYLYSLGGGAAGDRDIAVIMAAGGDTATSRTNYYFTSGVMDISIKNTESSTGCYVELYYWIGRKPLSNNNNFNAVSTTTFDLAIVNSFPTEPNNLGAGATLAHTTFGATPFQGAITEFIIIYKKQVIFLAAGQISDVSISKYGNKFMNADKLTEANVWDKHAKGVMLLLYGEPNSATDATAGQPVAANINVNITRTYHFKNNRPGLVDRGTCLLPA